MTTATQKSGTTDYKEALNIYGLDYVVKPQPTFQLTDTGYKAIKNKIAQTREDTDDVLSIMTESYVSVQNEEAFGFMQDVLTLTEARFIDGGVIDGGKRSFLTIELPGAIELRNDSGMDVLQKRIDCFNSFDGWSTIKYRFTPFRPVCENTFAVDSQELLQYKRVKELYSEKSVVENQTFKIYHNKQASENLKKAASLIHNAVIGFEAVEIACNQLLNTSISNDHALDFFKRLTLTPAEKDGKEASTRVENTRESLMEYFQTSPGNRGETLWDAFNAVTYHTTHKRNYAKGDYVKGIKIGTGDRMNNKAFHQAMQLANN